MIDENMPSLEKCLSQYAAYHLDEKNLYSHFIGIPMIVFAVMCFSSRFGVLVGYFDFTLSLLLIILLSSYYFTLDRAFALLMTLLLLAIYPFAYVIAQFQLLTWLGVSVGFFLVGWVVQFIGHIFEKKRPAFFDDIRGLIIGPLFVLVEFAFIIGYRKALQQQVLINARQLREQMNREESVINASAL